MKTCERCGAEIIQPRQRRYCSKECKKAAEKIRMHEKHIRTYKSRVTNGTVYVCKSCGDTVRATGWTRRQFCDQCLEAGALGTWKSMRYLEQRKHVDEIHERKEEERKNAS